MARPLRPRRQISRPVTPPPVRRSIRRCVPRASCHGPTAAGIAGLGKPLANSAFVAETSSGDLIVVVTKGRAVDDPLNTTGILMPPKGGNPALTDDDVADVVAYIKSLN